MSSGGGKRDKAEEKRRGERKTKRKERERRSGTDGNGNWGEVKG